MAGSTFISAQDVDVVASLASSGDAAGRSPPPSPSPWEVGDQSKGVRGREAPCLAAAQGAGQAPGVAVALGTLHPSPVAPRHPKQALGPAA